MPIKLQKSREIMINPSDKGAGIIVCDFEDYKNPAIEHKAKPDQPETYYNIPLLEGIECFKNALNTRKEKNRPNFITSNIVNISINPKHI
jgi:hypothetical protein